MEGGAVCRLAKDDPVPGWTNDAGWWSVARTLDVLPVIYREPLVPMGVTADRDWRLLALVGALPFDTVGVLPRLSEALARTGVPLLAVSTHDTDYVFVPADRLDDAVRTLAGAGHTVDSGAGDRGAR